MEANNLLGFYIRIEIKKKERCVIYYSFVTSPIIPAIITKIPPMKLPKISNKIPNISKTIPLNGIGLSGFKVASKIINAIIKAKIDPIIPSQLPIINPITASIIPIIAPINANQYIMRSFSKLNQPVYFYRFIYLFQKNVVGLIFIKLLFKYFYYALFDYFIKNFLFNF